MMRKKREREDEREERERERDEREIVSELPAISTIDDEDDEIRMQKPNDIVLIICT